MRFKALDGLRGLCALAVALLHLYNNMRLSAPPFIENAWALVDFFFVLSGFVLSHAFFEDLTENGAVGLFMLRRFGRLYPLHLFMLILFLLAEIAKYAAWRHGAAVSTVPFSEATTPASFASNLLLFQSMGLHDELTWNLPSWSISVEFYVNLLFALVVVLPVRCTMENENIRCQRNRISASLVAIFGLVTVIAALQGRIMTYDAGFVRCVYGFFCGVLTQRLLDSGFDPLRKFSSRILTALEITMTVAAVAFVVLGGQVWLFALAPPVFSAMTLVYAREQGPFSRLMLTRAFHFLGEWSYSIYMVHAFLLIHVLSRLAALAGKHGALGLDPGSRADGGQYLGAIYEKSPLSAAILLATFFASVLAVSGLTYHFIEKPARQYFNKLAIRGARSRSIQVFVAASKPRG